MRNFLTILLLSCLILPYFAFANPSIIIEIEPYTLSKFRFFEEYKGIGQIKFSDSLQIIAKNPGTVDFVTNSQGQQVKTGTVLITMNEVRVKQAKEAAEAAYNSAKISYERDVSLSNKKIISEDILHKSRVVLEESKLALIKAEEYFHDMIITAPFDGLVGVIKARIGDEVKAGDLLLTILNPSKMEALTELPQTLKGKITNNTVVYTTDPNLNQTKGKIIAISDYLSASGTFTAKIEFEASPNFTHGSFIELTLVYNEHEGISIPEKAVLKNNIGNFVYRITKENRIEQVYVKLGTRTNNNIELVSDKINLGDQLVLEGLTKVFEGAEVAFTPKKDIATDNARAAETTKPTK